VAHYTEGFNRFVASTVAPVASGWSILPGGAFTHWENAALSRRTPGAVVHLADQNFRKADAGAISETRCRSVGELQFTLDRLKAWLPAQRVNEEIGFQ
jgi:hypothetical protein